MSHSFHTSLEVLVAEDSPVNQRVAKRLLEQSGHRVTLAANGEEAIDALRHKAFDLVLMDVEMPRMDGLEATRAIRAAEPEHQRLPIIALTATGEASECFESGMDGWLPKPLSMARLSEVWNKLVACGLHGSPCLALAAAAAVTDCFDRSIGS